MKLPLWLFNYHATKTYVGREVRLHAFLIFVIFGGYRSDQRSGRVPALSTRREYFGEQHIFQLLLKILTNSSRLYPVTSYMTECRSWLRYCATRSRVRFRIHSVLEIVSRCRFL